MGSSFPDQGSTPHPLHWKEDSKPLDHQGSPLPTAVSHRCTGERVTVSKSLGTLSLPLCDAVIRKARALFSKASPLALAPAPLFCHRKCSDTKAQTTPLGEFRGQGHQAAEAPPQHPPHFFLWSQFPRLLVRLEKQAEEGQPDFTGGLKHGCFPVRRGWWSLSAQSHQQSGCPSRPRETGGKGAGDTFKRIHSPCGHNKHWLQKGFPGGAVVKNPPADAGTRVRSLVQEDSTCLGATKPMSHNY